MCAPTFRPSLAHVLSISRLSSTFRLVVFSVLYHCSCIMCMRRLPNTCTNERTLARTYTHTHRCLNACMRLSTHSTGSTMPSKGTCPWALHGRVCSTLGSQSSVSQWHRVWAGGTSARNRGMAPDTPHSLEGRGRRYHVCLPSEPAAEFGANFYKFNTNFKTQQASVSLPVSESVRVAIDNFEGQKPHANKRPSLRLPISPSLNRRVSWPYRERLGTAPRLNHTTCLLDGSRRLTRQAGHTLSTTTPRQRRGSALEYRCVFITEVPIIKLFGGLGELNENMQNNTRGAVFTTLGVCMKIEVSSTNPFPLASKSQKI
jgi:hypothetical protein